MLYPVMLNIVGKRCLVVGGGQVALRKTRELAKQGAEILVVSPKLCAEMEELYSKGIVKWLKESYEERHLEGVWICFACTDNKEVNEIISIDANKRNILVNVADNCSMSTFAVPAARRKGDVTIAVYSNENPAASRYIADCVSESLEDWVIRYVSAVKEIRALCKERIHDKELRQAFMRSLFEPQAIEMARGDLDSALRVARDKLKYLV